MQFTSTLLSAITLGALAVSAAPVENTMEKRDTHSGRATWYEQGGNAGSCGDYHGDNSHVIAVPAWMGSNLCGKSVTIQYQGKQTQATVADTCPGCDGYSIDLSRGAFSSLADFGVGEMQVQWWQN